jgi:hypothetical protein
MLQVVQELARKHADAADAALRSALNRFPDLEPEGRRCIQWLFREEMLMAMRFLLIKYHEELLLDRRQSDGTA